MPILIIGYVSCTNSKIALERKVFGALQALVHSGVPDILHDIELRQEEAKELVETFFSRQLESDGINDTSTIAKIQKHIYKYWQRENLVHDLFLAQNLVQQLNIY